VSGPPSGARRRSPECTARNHRAELRRRDTRRAQRQCRDCLRPVGKPIALEQLEPAARARLPLWQRRRGAKRGTRRARRYRAFLSSAAWRRQRLRVLERDGYRCRGLGCGQPATSVHHLRYAPVLAETPDADLAASCARCNETERERRVGSVRRRSLSRQNQGVVDGDEDRLRER
jgi:hypothetical protein